MTDFSSFSDAPWSPATRGVAVSPHDVTPLGVVPKGLYVGGAGDVVARGLGDAADVTFRGVPAGTVLPFRARHIRATGTTATHIVALA